MAKLTCGGFYEEKRKEIVLNEHICSITCDKAISRCPNLTHLYYVKVYKGLFVNGIGINAMIQLQDALARGNLPSLTHLCFESCRSGLV